MTGIRIIFSEDGIRFDFDNPVKDFECTAQNALVNIGTRKGSDPMFPERGTDLLKTALSGAIVDLNSAAHASNLAAVDTLFFSRTWEQAGNTERMAKVQLDPLSIQDRCLQLDAVFTSTDGNQIGTSTPLL